jgi:hypothetical protein
MGVFALISVKKTKFRKMQLEFSIPRQRALSGLIYPIEPKLDLKANKWF